MKIKQKALGKKLKAQEEDTLRGIASAGSSTSTSGMVEALKAPGCGWGGDYTGAKDFMHFEVV